MKIEKRKFHAPHVKINEEYIKFNRYAVMNFPSFLITTTLESLRDIAGFLQFTGLKPCAVTGRPFRTLIIDKGATPR
jgi:hypothetical protein